jgi:hypothetical protein
MPPVAFRAGFHPMTGPLAQTLAVQSNPAVRAARGLSATDPTTWSTDAAVQPMMASRSGWLTAPAMMLNYLAASR